MSTNNDRPDLHVSTADVEVPAGDGDAKDPSQSVPGRLPSQLRPGAEAADAIFDQLDRIKSIHAAITEAHCRLENVVAGGGGGGGGGGRQDGSGGPSSRSRFPEDGWDGDGVVDGDGSGEGRSGTGGVGVGEEGIGRMDGGGNRRGAGIGGKIEDEREKERNKAASAAAHEAYEGMTNEFRERQKGVEDVMEKVCLFGFTLKPAQASECSLITGKNPIYPSPKLRELTSAMKAFHDLPAPVLFPPGSLSTSLSTTTTTTTPGARSTTQTGFLPKPPPLDSASSFSSGLQQFGGQRSGMGGATSESPVKMNFAGK